MKIFAGNGCPSLATSVAQRLDTHLASMQLSQFNDGEINVEINEHVRGEDVFIIQSTCAPANDNLMELATISDALRRSDAGRIIAVIPYYGYSRQDRRPDFKRTPITSRLVADLLQAAGIDYVVTVDIHSEQQQGFFNVPFVNVSAFSILVDHIKRSHSNFVIVSPDIGGVKRARNLANMCEENQALAIIDKRRTAPGESSVMNVIGNVEGQTCILVDDMIDTAGTLCKAAAALKDHGAREVFAYATHPILSANAGVRIADSVIDKVIVTDTIPLADSNNYKVIYVESVARLLASVIRRIHNNESISRMYGYRIG